MEFIDARSLMLCADRVLAPRSGMKSRRLTPQYLPCFRTKGIAHLSTVGDCCTAGFRSATGPDSVIPVLSAARPLFPRKRKSIRDLAMSHKCHEPTFSPNGTLWNVMLVGASVGPR